MIFFPCRGPYRSPRANRFIVHSDVNNPTVSSLEAFGGALEDFSPDLLLVSGLQMMDNFPFPEGMRKERLGKIREQVRVCVSGRLAIALLCLFGSK